MKIKKLSNNLIHCHFDEIDSTQRYCINNLHNIIQNMGEQQFYCITAGIQTAGIGKYSAKWFSPPGNFYSTYVIASDKQRSNLELVQGTAVAVTSSLLTFKIPAQIKWLNDILIHNKKVAGILCETIELNSKFYMIIGIGINLKYSPDNNTSTSVLQSYNQEIDCNDLVEVLGSNLHYNLARADREDIVSDYRARLAHKNVHIQFMTNNTLENGILTDLDSAGQLQIRVDNVLKSFMDCKIISFLTT